MSLEPVQWSARRWAIFAVVGATGFVVQLGATWLLADGLHFHYVVATFMATELAILQNFCGHRRWTWSDRRDGDHDRTRRFLRFHLASGATAFAGIAVVMPLLVEAGHMHYLLASTLTVVVCAFANFIANDRMVFASTPPRTEDPPLLRERTRI